MRWTPGGRSRDIIDRRGAGGGFGGFRLGGGRGLGIGGVIILLILSVIFRQDFFSMLGGGGTTYEADVPPGAVASTPEEERMVQFVSFVLDSAQNHWERTLASEGAQYPRAKLVLFRDAVQSACGFAEAVSGPFYCPADHQIYIDLSFFDELDRRFGAPGDFAQAYVLAHEVGHHVQTVLGIADRVRQLQQSSPGEANQVQVRMELQADCLAGVWGHATKQMGILEAGDVEEGMGAASAVGDDRIQRQTQGRVNPDAFTHGSSAQRVSWFMRGFQSGSPNDCDTFGQSPNAR